MNRIPKSWDSGLEALLATTSYEQANVKWGNTVSENMGKTKTFIEAINKKMPAGNITRTVNLGLNKSSKTREAQIRRMILAPLSPRKPIVIPCLRSVTREHDKQEVEKAVQQKHYRAVLAQFTPPAASQTKRALYRETTIEKRGLASLRPRSTTFYWGA